MGGKRKVRASDVEQADAEDIDVCRISEDDDRVLAVVKMKLATLCKNERLRKHLDMLVMRMNRLLGEAYAFSNHHILNLLRSGAPLPVLDRNFFYRCLVAVGTYGTQESPIVDLEAQGLFDRLRGDEPKVEINGCAQILADLSITMATMAKNHVWMNLEKRIIRYLRWKHPKLRKYHTAIVNGLVREPKTVANRVIPGELEADASAREILAELRGLMPLPSKLKAASVAHMTLPLYMRILEETETAKALFAGTENKQRFRTFSLLPTKGGYTICHIPISNMTFMQLLKDLKLETFNGDGRDVDRSVWSKYFNLNAFETRNRKFDYRIVTDGYAVSVQISKTSGPRCPCSDCLDKATCRVALSDEESSTCVGVDPGFTDVVTVSEHGVEKARSFSSARYYEIAGFNLSARRTTKWNAETEAIVQDIPSNETTDISKMEDYVRHYLRVLPAMLKHRATAGYRYMRLFRYTKRAKAIRTIVDFIAPPGKFNVVMFGDWKGGAGSPISRRTCGPLEAIKFALRSRPDVDLRSVDEFRTSVTCSKCHCQLTNMKAKCMVKNRKTGAWEARRSKIHKVLHCSNSVLTNKASSQVGCGTTWDRDVNASRNILTLGLLDLFERPRPSGFCRTTKPTRTSRGKRSTDRPGNPQEPGPSLLSLMPVRTLLASRPCTNWNTSRRVRLSAILTVMRCPSILAFTHWVTVGVPL